MKALGHFFQIAQSVIKHPRRAPYYAGKLMHALDYGNIDYHMLNGYSFPPRSVCLILSDRCNLKCAMCDIGQRNRSGLHHTASSLVDAVTAGGKRMDRAGWLSLIGELAAFRPRPLVLLTGTEPLLYPDVLDVIGTITQNRLPLHITTNGTLLKQYASQIVSLCQKGPGSDITVSLDDIGAAHDTIRGVTGTFERAVEGLHAVAGERDKRQSPYPLLSITCTITHYNQRNLLRFARWIIDTGAPVESITFNHLWFTDERIVHAHNSIFGKRYPVQKQNTAGLSLDAIDMEAVHGQLLKIADACSRAGLRMRQQPDLTLEEARCYYSNPCRFVYHTACTAAWRNVSVTPGGDVILSPLCFLPPAGNVLETSFYQLWNGSVFRNIRRKLKQRKAFPACSRCCMLFGSKAGYHIFANRLKK